MLATDEQVEKVMVKRKAIREQGAKRLKKVADERDKEMNVIIPDEGRLSQECNGLKTAETRKVKKFKAGSSRPKETQER